MTRIVVILSLCLAACDVGDASKGQNGLVTDSGVKMDTGSGGGADAAPLTPHNHTAPLNAANPTNAGQPCLSANCHGTVTPAGPQFAFAGTVYTTSAHTAGAGNVMVHAGTLLARSDTAGNFYAYAPPNITIPCMTDVTTMTMSAPLATGGGDCNSSNCHQQPNGSQGGIYK